MAEGGQVDSPRQNEAVKALGRLVRSSFQIQKVLAKSFDYEK
jgi:hypothetical protein